MRILLIGGTRFIGAAVVRRLAARGHELAVLNRGESPLAPPDGVLRLVGDRDRLAASADAIRAFAPETVIHNICLNDRQVRDLQDVVRGVAGRLVLVSSVDVYRAYGRLIGTETCGVLPTPIPEDGELRTVLYPYRSQAKDESDLRWSYDKIPAEKAALDDAALPGTVLRLPMVIGENDYQHRLFPLWKPMADGRPAIVMSASQAAWRDTLGYVENVAAAVAAAAEDPRAAGRTYNVGDADLTSRELAELVATGMAWSGEIVVRPDATLPEALRPSFAANQDLHVSTERLRTELAWTPPVALEDALARTLAWEQANPPATPPPGFPPYEAEDLVLAG